MTKIEIPSFTSEAEEAQWWFDNREALDDEFLAAAAAEGKLGHGTLAKQFDLVSNIVQLDPEDALLAQELAAKRGLDYELYMQNLIHETLLERAVCSKEQEAAHQGTSTTIAA